MEKRTAAKTAEDIEKAKRYLDAANKQLEEAKRGLEEVRRQPPSEAANNYSQPVAPPTAATNPAFSDPGLPGVTFKEVPTTPGPDITLPDGTVRHTAVAKGQHAGWPYCLRN